ncbi:MAG: 6-pyruvoyl trahydropterin synthase family protein [bacterium]
MYTIQKEFHFSASHQLNSLPTGHKCKNLHGHNYVVIVGFASQDLDDHGFVIDYGDLSPIKSYIDRNLDHQHLNSVFPSMETTAENLAKFLYDLFEPVWHEKLAFVTVKETEKTSATYRP